MKVEPEDNSSDDDRGAHQDDTYDNDHYQDESDVPDENDFLPTNIVNVSLKDGDLDSTVDKKPKKLSAGRKKSSSGE